MNIYEIDAHLPTGQRVPLVVKSELPPTDVTEWLGDLTTFTVVGFRVEP